MKQTDLSTSILRFINGRNDSADYLQGMYEYVADSTKTDGGTLVATQGCSKKNPLADMLTNKMLRQKTQGNQGVHFVLSCPPNGDAKSPADLLKVTQEIVRTVYPDYLAVIAVHLDTQVVHSHVIMDTVNAVTGKKFSQGPGDLNRVKQKANGILKAHGFEIIRMSANDFVDHTDYSKVTGFDFLELDETEFITETDMQAASIDAELISEPDYFDNWSECAMLTSSPDYYGGIVPMNTSNNYVPETQQPQETPAPLLVEQDVPTAAVPSRYPTTTVATGPTFRIKGTPQSDFTGLNELVMQTATFAQEHQREAANLALAMQSKAQEMGLPTNVSVIAGPIIDIDLYVRFEQEDDVVYGDYGD